MKNISTKSNPTNRFYQELYAPVKNEIHKALLHYYLICLSPTYYKKVAKDGDTHKVTTEAYDYLKETIHTYVKNEIRKSNIEAQKHDLKIKYDEKEILDKATFQLTGYRSGIKQFITMITKHEYNTLPELDSLERFGKNHIQAWSYYLRSLTTNQAMFFFKGYPDIPLKDESVMKQLNNLLSKSSDNKMLRLTHVEIMYSHLLEVLRDTRPHEVQEFNFDLKKSYTENLEIFDKYLQNKLARSVYSVHKSVIEETFDSDLESLTMVEFKDTRTGMEVIWIDTGVSYIDNNKLKGGTCGTVFGLHEKRDDACIFLMCFLKKPDKEVYTPIIWATYSPLYRVILECRGVANQLVMEDYHQYLIPLFELKMDEVYSYWDKTDLKKKPYYLNAILELYYYANNSNVDMINPHQLEPHVYKKILEIRPDIMSDKMLEYYKDELVEKVSLEDFVKSIINLEGRDSPSEDFMIEVLSGEAHYDYEDTYDSNWEDFIWRELIKVNKKVDNYYQSDFMGIMKEYEDQFESLEEFKSNFYSALDGSYNSELYRHVKKAFDSWCDDNLGAKVEWDYSEGNDLILKFQYVDKIKNTSDLKNFLIGFSRYMNVSEDENTMDTKSLYLDISYVTPDDKETLEQFKEIADYKEFQKELKKVAEFVLNQLPEAK